MVLLQTNIYWYFTLQCLKLFALPFVILILLDFEVQLLAALLQNAPTFKCSFTLQNLNVLTSKRELKSFTLFPPSHIFPSASFYNMAAMGDFVIDILLACPHGEVRSTAMEQFFTLSTTSVNPETIRTLHPRHFLLQVTFSHQTHPNPETIRTLHPRHFLLQVKFSYQTQPCPDETIKTTNFKNMFPFFYLFIWINIGFVEGTSSFVDI